MADAQALHLPAALIIMDGYGLGRPGPTNAIDTAHTPCLDHLYANCPWIPIQASGEYVGLPDGQMGNSEVGHLNIGAGRIVYQELTRINTACKDGSLKENTVINKALDIAQQNDSVLHLMGLVSDGGVHSSNEHLYALVKHAKEYGVPHIFIHCFLDGRDVAPTSAYGYIEELLSFINEQNDENCHIEIATIMGRYYAMDRDNRWERVEQAYRCLAFAEGLTELDPLAFIQASYDAGVTDEFVVPGAFSSRGIHSNDALIFFNFRPDRAREITHCFTDKKPFEGLEAIRPHFVCLTEYDPNIPASVAFPKTFPEDVLADVLSTSGLRQYHIAETEKYAHVTFFLNGGIEAEKAGEKRVLIPSPKVATYDLQPEMSAPEVSETLAHAIENDEADVYIVNFANCDMVGHTGVLEAAIAAVETVDHGIQLVLDALKSKGGVAIVTADHGNADVMCSEDGSPHTAHTTNPVPMILVDYSDSQFKFAGEAHGALCNLAPTLLDMIGIKKPEKMEAESLLA
ncbi:MAG: 2,3-bisphosphoglycerate-independent phosphoglycerate mutase [Eggerthellaceae bacterium]|nr:2,3-bisphosphoglycerate-independent phosphoglycerate mutase [Eggerthellaceae bacterium]